MYLSLLIDPPWTRSTQAPPAAHDRPSSSRGGGPTQLPGGGHLAAQAAATRRRPRPPSIHLLPPAVGAWQRLHIIPSSSAIRSTPSRQRRPPNVARCSSWPIFTYDCVIVLSAHPALMSSSQAALGHFPSVGPCVPHPHDLSSAPSSGATRAGGPVPSAPRPRLQLPLDRPRVRADSAAAGMCV